jgi:alanine racemase
LQKGYGVVRLDEAKKIRSLSDKKILLMQGIYSNDEFLEAHDSNLDVVIHNLEQFQIVKENNIFDNLWLKINTGMNRLGFEINDFMKIYNEYFSNKKFTLMTHLAASNNKNSISNQHQIDLFEDLSKKMHKDVYKSIANTGCIMNFPDHLYDWVRCGIGIYGGYFKDSKIKTAMTLRSPIVNIRKIKKNDKVGYDGRAVAKNDMLIATVYLGYADGLPLNIKDGTDVIINDQRAKVFGRVSMDLTTIDITNINNCVLGNWCEFFSRDLPISNIAESNDLISYYLMTGVKSRVKKIYKRAD